MGQLKSAFSCVHVWREKVFLSCDLLSNNKMAVISKFERGKALGMTQGMLPQQEVRQETHVDQGHEGEEHGCIL